MTSEELRNLLTALVSGWENEVVEFKEGGAGFSTHDLGKYFSALAKEANLRGVERAWLVFGVHNKSRKVVGSAFDVSPETVNKSGGLKYQITQSTDPGMCFTGIHVLDHEDGKVIFFEIPVQVHITENCCLNILQSSMEVCVRKSMNTWLMRSGATLARMKKCRK